MMPNWSDERVEKVIGGLLQIGVLLSGIIVLAGGILYWKQYGALPARYHTFDPRRTELHGVVPVLMTALHGDSRAVIELGLLLLIATPVSRVVFSVVAFAMQRDLVYVSVTLVVLAILLYSLFGST